jgi:hypothetical protein
MKHEAWDRLFPSDLSDDTAERMFFFLSQITETFFEVYTDQICRNEPQQTDEDGPPPEYVDDDCHSDDDEGIPW